MKYLLTYDTYLLKYKSKSLDIETDTIIESIINNNLIIKKIIDSSLFSENERLLLYEYYNDIIINEGFSDFLDKMKKKVGSVATKSWNVAKKVGNSVKKFAQGIAFIVKVILKEFDKAYILFSENATKDAKVAATWTLERYPYINRAAKKTTNGEKTWLESVISFFKKLMEKIKSKWQNTIKSSVNESILDSDMEELLIESGVIKKASSIINNQLSKTEDDDNKTKKLPKGFWGKLIGSVTKVADWAVDIMDIFYKSKARASLSGLSIALDKSGGPKKPDNGINHLGTLYSHAGIHSQGGIAGGGMLKNWKRTLGVAIRQTVSFAVSSIQSVIGPIMSIIISIIQIVKKLQVCVFMTRMANGDMKKEKIDKESTKDLSGGVKKFLAKDAE